MTLKDIVVEIFEALGEPSDLDFWTTRPSSSSDGVINTSSVGWKRLVAVVNDAQVALASWKWPNGRPVRMRFSEDMSFLSIGSSSGVLSGITTNTVLMTGLPVGSGLQTGKLLVGSTSGAMAVVFWSYGTLLTLSRLSGTFTEGETGTLYQREFRFVAVAGSSDPTAAGGIPYLTGKGVPVGIVSVVDLDGGAAMEETVESERFITPELGVGTPTMMYRLPGGFLFDLWPEAGRTYGVRYQRGPTPLTTADSAVEPELPSQFHWGLVLWGTWWGLRRNQESNDAYAVRKDLEDFMMKVRTEEDYLDDMIEGQVKIYPQGR